MEHNEMPVVFDQEDVNDYFSYMNELEQEELSADLEYAEE